MIIGIDARLYGHGLGLGRYISKLIEHLERRDDAHTYIIFLRKQNFQLYTPRNARFKKVCADVPWYSFREQWLLPWIFLQSGCDLLHIPHFNVPLLYPKKIIITIHDIILLQSSLSATSAASTRAPFVHWLKYQSYRFVLRASLARACRVIAVSRSVGNDLLAFFPSLRNKLRIVYEAADALPTASLLVDPRFDTSQQFFLYAGNAYPHKNISTLLEAMSVIHASLTGIRLILCGQEDFFQKKLKAEIEKRGLAAVSYHVGCVSDSVLRWLYEHARAVVLPSLHEGFGLQILEAFVHSCPVIASRIPPYQEVGGDAALFIDAARVDDIVQAMSQLVRDNTLRRAMIQRGLRRARDFSWDATARETTACYDQCMRES